MIRNGHVKGYIFRCPLCGRTKTRYPHPHNGEMVEAILEMMRIGDAADWDCGVCRVPPRFIGVKWSQTSKLFLPNQERQELAETRQRVF